MNNSFSANDVQPALTTGQAIAACSGAKGFGTVTRYSRTSGGYFLAIGSGQALGECQVNLDLIFLWLFTPKDGCASKKFSPIRFY